MNLCFFVFGVKNYNPISPIFNNEAITHAICVRA